MTTTARERTTTDRQVSIRQPAVDRVLGPFRLPAADAADLRWLLLGEWVGDGIIRSNFGPMVLQAERLAAAVSDDADPPRMFPSALAARHWHERESFRVWQMPQAHETFSRRPIAIDLRLLDASDGLRELDDLRWRWRGLGPEHRETLRAMYGHASLAPPEWGEIWPVVLVSRVAARLYAKSRDNRGLVSWLTRLPALKGAASRLMASEIRRDADSRLLAASLAWEATFRRHRAA